MIISHKYKYIFLKTNKTAGTSIEIALSKFCGPDDIITPISSEDEKTRSDLGYPGAQNYLTPISDLGVRGVIKTCLKGKRVPRYFNHISAKEVKNHIGEEIWNSYYKFCFERNPWDRMVSLYYWRCRTEPRPTISEFVESAVPLALKRKGIELYSIDGKVAVDKVCFFENLSEDLESIRKQLGIPEKLELPRAKSKFRTEKKGYRELMGQEDQEKISKLFSDEINLWGYKF